MNLTDFSPLQQQALLDLAVLAMYADGHLASAEDDRLSRLLVAYGQRSEYDRNQAFDAAVARVRPHLGSAEKMRVFIVNQAGVFETASLRQYAVDVLDDLLASDNKVTEAESRCAAAIHEAFQVSS